MSSPLCRDENKHLIVFPMRISDKKKVYLGGAGSSAVSSSTTALSLSPRLSNLSRASQGGESLVPVLLSANLLCNCRITLCCRRIMDSR